MRCITLCTGPCSNRLSSQMLYLRTCSMCHAVCAAQRGWQPTCALGARAAHTRREHVMDGNCCLLKLPLMPIMLLLLMLMLLLLLMMMMLPGGI